MSMISVCVKCNAREKGFFRTCPKCRWLMLDGPLPPVGSILLPRKPLGWQGVAVIAGSAFVLFFGGVAMAVSSLTGGAAADAHAPVIAEAPAVVAPVAAPAPAPVVAEPVVLASSVKAVAAKPAPAKKKVVAKKTTAKKPAKKSSSKSTKVARRN